MAYPSEICSAHGLLPGWSFPVIVLFMAGGGFLLLLLAEYFLVTVPRRSGGILYGISVLTALQSAAEPDQIVRRITMPSCQAGAEPARSAPAALSPGWAEQWKSLFFPVCISFPLIWATSRASASICSRVGQFPAWVEICRSRAVCVPTLAFIYIHILPSGKFRPQ